MFKNPFLILQTFYIYKLDKKIKVTLGKFQFQNEWLHKITCLTDSKFLNVKSMQNVTAFSSRLLLF